MHTGNLDLTLDQITKIEGHAKLDVKIRDGKVVDLKFSIAEFKRFYTKALEGKSIAAVPQLVARICGTCSNAHLLCSIKAIEDAQQITPSPQTIKFRRLLNNGLIIRDHALHLYIFSLPDVFGKDSLFDFDEKDPAQHELLHDALAVKEAGNQLAIITGGRSVHAPAPTIGGFLTWPSQEKVQPLIDQLLAIRPKVLKLIQLFLDCPFELREDIAFSAIQSNTYDYLYGDLITNEHEPVPSKSYGEHLTHVVIPYSQASGYTFDDKVYMVGALARLNLSKQFLNEKTKQDAGTALSVFPSKNIYHNNLAQAIEILNAVDDSIELLTNTHVEQEKLVSYAVRAGVGVGVIEAPRGALYHRYEINDQGLVTKAQIVVPTGQNQVSIEKSLLHYVEKNMDKSKEELSKEFEKIIRAYDPCMSCASHFLELKLK